MATEQYANNAQTTLDGAIDDSVTTLTVVNASAFPPAPQFRVRIDNELLLVTGLSGMDNEIWTVERHVEQPPAAAAPHSDGATVTQVLTAASLQNLLPLTTQGDLLVHDGTNNVRLGVGSNGQVLTADSAEAAGVKWAAGSGGAPTDAEYLVGAASGGLSAERVVTDTTGTTGITWDLATAGQAKANATNAGKWVKLATATASSSATVDFTGLSGSYVAYMVVLSHVAPATDGVSPLIRTSADNGSSYAAGANNYEWTTWRFTSGTAVANNSGATAIDLIGGGGVQGNASNEEISGSVLLAKPSASNYGSLCWQLVYVNTSAVLGGVMGSGRRRSAAAVNAIRFLFSSGNIASGQFDLFGLAA